MRWGIALVQLMGRGAFSGSLRAAWSEANEVRRALDENNEQGFDTTLDPGMMSAGIDLTRTGVTGRPD